MPLWWSEPSGFHAFVLSLVSLVFTLIAAVGGIAAYYKLDSSLILVYGLENSVDFLSSAIVLWRFFLPHTSDAAEEANLLSREKRASVGISVVLALLGFVIIITAFADFAAGKETVESLYRDELYYISFVSIFIFGIMTVLKFRYARKLNSSSLRKDGICSALGTILAVSLFFNTILAAVSNGNMWWLDPFIALTCGIGSLIYGLVGIYKAYVRDGLPIHTCSWWMYDKRERDTIVVTNNGGLSVPPTASFSRGHVTTEMSEEIV